MLKTIMAHRRRRMRGTLAACATVLLVAAPWVAASSAAAAAVPAAVGHGLKKVHDPGRVTGTIHGHCSYRDHGQLPDPRCTPGSIDPRVTRADIRSTICKKGWTSTVRPPESQTERFKYDVAYPAYRTPRSQRTELDHLVPLELGGSNDATNLWPEHPPTPNPKDKVENALNAAVCQGRVSLSAAQDAIAADWLTAEKKLGLGGGGGGGRAWCTASASYNAKYRDYDVYVHSNQPDRTVTATASNGAAHSYRTDSSGYADVYLHAASGDTVKVTAGAASCSTAA
ncbi:MAG: hypothetical protein ACRDOE_23900 [Streptosporangiaceae bacterium]